MVKVKKEWDNFLIWKDICFGSNEWFQDNYINLAETLWPDMSYWSKEKYIIEYPGEYDIQNIFLKVYLWNDNKLNYLIRKNKKNFVIIQSVNILENKNFEKIDCWVFTDNKFVDLLDKLELEWEKIYLNETDIEENWEEILETNIGENIA
jgi:hypothetical protein